MSAFAKNMLTGAKWPLLLIGLHLLFDTTSRFVSSLGEQSMSILLAAMAVSVGYHGLIALLCAPITGLLAVYIAGKSDISSMLNGRLEELKRSLNAQTRSQRVSFAEKTVSLLLGLAFLVGASLLPVSRVIVEIETPIFAAILSVGIFIAALVLVLALSPVFLRTGHLFSSLLPKLPSPQNQLLALAAVGATASSILVFLTWESVGYAIPWRGPLCLVLAAISWVLLSWFKVGQRLPGTLRRGLTIALPVLGLAGLLFMAFLPRSLVEVNNHLSQGRGLTPAVHGAIDDLLDFDQDGFLSFLGQGDCAPWASKIHPAAYDVPKDGIDQDCSGKDNHLDANLTPGRWDYPASPKPEPMPLILITLDTAAAYRMDLYGNERESMPRLTAQAGDAAVFDWAFSEAPSTRTTFPSMMTGKYCTEIRRVESKRAYAPWHKSNVTFAQLFHKAGFKTEAVAPDPLFSKKFRWIYKGFNKVDRTPAKRGIYNITGSSVTKAALAAIDRLKNEDKFVLWVHYTDSHETKGKYVLPKGIEPFPPGKKPDYYDKSLSVLDGYVDRLLTGIRQRMGSKKHVVFLAADHGESFDQRHAKKGHHGWDLSTTVTRIPMIVWSPYSGSRRISRLASTIDIAPTLFNMVGLKTGNFSGDSLLPSIQGALDPERPILQMMYLPERIARGKSPMSRTSVRLEDMVLHREGAKISLYNFKSDPEESNNLADADPELASSLDQLRASMVQAAAVPPLDNQPSKP